MTPGGRAGAIGLLIGWIGMLAILIFGLCSCESEPMRFDNPGKFSQKTQYFRDHRGNCFAIVGIRRTAATELTGIGLAHVPSENCR